MMRSAFRTCLPTTGLLGLLLASGVSFSAQPAKPPRAKPAAAMAVATKAPAAQSLPAPEKVASVEGITEYRLANGLRVLLFPDPSKPAITVNTTFLVGSRHESYGETGMAHLLEHLVFKPSRHYSGKDGTQTPVQVLNSVGARFNGTTWLDRTNYYVTFPVSGDNFEKILDLEADRMVNANIDAKDLWDPVEKKGEMTVVRNEFEGGENNPFQVTLQRTLHAAFEWHNYGKSTIGARSDVENVNIEHLKAFYRKFYQPDNAVLLVAGRFEEAKALELVNRKFGAIPKPSRVIEPTWTLDPAQDGERQVVVRRVGDTQLMMAAYKMPAGADPEHAALEVLGRVMGDTPGGRLHKALVETKKAATVFPFIFDTKEPGIAIFGAQFQKDGDAEELKSLLLKTLEQSAGTPITQEEVDRAKQQLLKQVDLTLNESDRLGVGLSEYIAQGDWRLFFLQRDRIKKVTPIAVRSVAAKYLKRENRTLGQFIPTEKPDRAEIPAAPEVAALVKDYKGGERVAAGEAFDASPANIDTRTRKLAIGGIKAAFVPKKTRGESVSATLTLRFGSEATLMGHDEVGGLTADLLMRGSAKHTRQQIKDEFDRLKAQVSLSGTSERLNVRITTTRPNLPAVIDLVAEVLRTPAFDAEEFSKLVNEQVTQYEQTKSEPATKARTALQRHLSPYPKGHPRYAGTVEETIAEIKALKVEDAKALHRDFYGAAGELAVVGDFDDQALEAQLQKLLGDWKAPKTYERMPDRLKADLQTLSEKIETPDKAQAIFIATLPFAMKDNDPDYPAMVLGNYLLGGGAINSRIANRLRQKEGLSYGAGSQFNANTLDAVASWVAFAIFAPENRERLEAAFQEELKLALEKGFTEEEVKAAKTSWMQAQATSRAQDRELAGRLAGNLFVGRTMAWSGELEAKVQALGNDQILAALRRHLDPAKLNIVRAGDFAKAAKDTGKK